MHQLPAVTIGLGICALEGRRGRALLYALVVPAWIVFLGILGNRNELFVAVIAGVLWYYSLGRRLRFSRMALVGVAGFVVMRLIEATRGEGVTEIGGSIGAMLADPEFWNPLNVASGSESMAAHISMHGVLARNLDFTYGSSLLHLINSLVPRIFSSNRIEDSYTIYANAVSALDTQGFNIHYAAAWYLNFGLVGIPLGAVVVAAIWGGLFRAFVRRHSAGLKSFAPIVASFCFCTAYAPVIMRGGPEGLKGLLVEGMLIPYALSWVALRRIWVDRGRHLITNPG